MEYIIPDEVIIKLDLNQWIDIISKDAIWYLGDGDSQLVIMSRTKARKIETKLGTTLENT